MTNSLVDEIWWINGSVRLEFKWSLFALWWKLYGWLQFGMPLQLKAGTPLEWRLWSRLTSSDLKVSTHLQCFLFIIRRCALECPPWKRGKILLHETSKSRCKSFSFLPGGHFYLDRSVMMKTSKTLNLTNLIPSMISLPSSAKLSLELLIDLYARQSTQW